MLDSEGKEQLMLTTYRAILNGDRIKWLDTPPAQLDGVEVNITLV
jgi:hypothetical protein